MKKHTLSNGLRIVAEQIPSSRSVSIGIWVKTGSRHEHQDHNGVSHLIEHMLFKGTSRYSAKAIAEIFDGIGGNVNAFTSKEYTCYYAKVLDTHLPLAVEVLSDMYLHSLFDQEELRKEINVILEEIAMYEDTPDDYVHDLIAEAAYGTHPLAYPILGTEDVLKSMTSSSIRNYMNRHYHTGNTVVSLAGNINDEGLETVERYFNSFSVRGQETDLSAPQFASQLKFHAKSTEQDHLCLALPGLALKDDRLYAMILLNNIIGGGMSSRLFQEIREQQGLAYSVYSYHSAHSDSGMFTIYAGSHPRHTKEVLKLTMDVLEDIVSKGVTEAEVHKGKEQLKGNVILSLESTSSRMNRNGKNELMLGTHQSLDEMIAKIDRITMDQVEDLIKQLFSQPFAAALVGGSDQALIDFDQDRFTGSSI